MMAKDARVRWSEILAARYGQISGIKLSYRPAHVWIRIQYIQSYISAYNVIPSAHQIAQGILGFEGLGRCHLVQSTVCRGQKSPTICTLCAAAPSGPRELNSERRQNPIFLQRFCKIMTYVEEYGFAPFDEIGSHCYLVQTVALDTIT